jgi:hypothetical protein
MTPDGLVKAIAPVVREYVTASLARVRGELEALVKAIPAGPPGEPGAPGVGTPGRDGLDGADGLGFDDLNVEYDGERLVTLTFSRGAIVKRFPLELPIPIDRGVWVSTKTYVRGDVVSWRGGGWICQHEAAAGMLPGEGGVWRLAVKKGSDARRDRGNRGGDHAGNGTAHD